MFFFLLGLEACLGKKQVSVKGEGKLKGCFVFGADLIQLGSLLDDSAAIIVKLPGICKNLINLELHT